MNVALTLKHCAVLGAVVVGLGTVDAHADAVADFYKGKTVNLVIGSGEGASYDLVGRLVGQHLQRRIPGNPIIVSRSSSRRLSSTRSPTPAPSTSRRSSSGSAASARL